MFSCIVRGPFCPRTLVNFRVGRGSTTNTNETLRRMASLFNRTENLDSVKTRRLIIQNQDGSYPAISSIPIAGDAQGTIGFSGVTADANGNLYVPGVLTVTGSVSQSTTGVVYTSNLTAQPHIIGASDTAGLNPTYLYLQPNAGRVAIGGSYAIAPTATLDVCGSAIIRNGLVVRGGGFTVDASGNASVNSLTLRGGFTGFISGADVSGNISGNARSITGDLSGSKIQGNISGNAVSITGDISGSKVKGDISGNATSITGTIRGNQISSDISSGLIQGDISGKATGIVDGFSIPGSQVFSDIPGNAEGINGYLDCAQLVGEIEGPFVTRIDGNLLQGTISFDDTDGNLTIKGDVISGALGKPGESDQNRVTLSGSNITGDISGGQIAGFLTQADISGSRVRGDISGAQIVGLLTRADISGSRVRGDISGAQILGLLTRADIAGSRVRGDISGGQIYGELGFRASIDGFTQIRGLVNANQVSGSLTRADISGSSITGTIEGSKIVNTLNSSARIAGSQITGSISGLQISGDISSNAYIKAENIIGQLAGSRLTGQITNADISGSNVTGDISGAQITGLLSPNALITQTNISGTIDVEKISGVGTANTGFSIDGSKVTGTITGDKITGNLSNATIDGLDIIGPINASDICGNLTYATINGSQVTNSITTATLPFANVIYPTGTDISSSMVDASGIAITPSLDRGMYAIFARFKNSIDQQKSVFTTAYYTVVNSDDANKIWIMNPVTNQAGVSMAPTLDAKDIKLTLTPPPQAGDYTVYYSLLSNAIFPFT